MAQTVAEILDRVSWMEWDEQVALVNGLCEYMGEIGLAMSIDERLKARARGRAEHRLRARAEAVGEAAARKLDLYIRNAHLTVEGWLDDRSAEFIASLGCAQTRHGLNGAVGEIGVHMGRLFILLYLLRREEEGSFAIDVFGRQDLNVDRSGYGDRAIFRRNLESWAGGDPKVEVFERSSLDVGAAEVRDKVGPCRLISIDGGHTEACTLNDLRLAEAVLDVHGVAVLDDQFNEQWPDVSTGFASYCFDPDSKLRPFAISPNKVYLARPEMHAFYRGAMEELEDLSKRSTTYRCEVDLYGFGPRGVAVTY